MFTCCKNTFPNFNITHSQTFIHSFLVRWLDVSAKRKQNRKKSSDLCTKEEEGRGVGGERFLKTQEVVLHSEGGKLGTRGHETEGDCWRICVHLNPEREKVTDSHRNFLLFIFYFLTDHTSVRYAPLPSSSAAPLGLWQHCERRFKSPRVVLVVVVEGWGHSHTQEWNISCGFVSIHTVLIC